MTLNHLPSPAFGQDVECLAEYRPVDALHCRNSVCHRGNLSVPQIKLWRANLVLILSASGCPVDLKIECSRRTVYVDF